MKSEFYLNKIVITTLFIVSVFLLFPSPGYSDSRVAENPTGNKIPVRKIGPHEYKIGSVTLNKDKKEIYISGSVNMQSGLVEYLACHAEVGKLHESVLKLESKPSDLQVALLLLGFKHKNTLKFQGDPTIPDGDPLEIWVEWESEDKTKKKVRAEDMVYDQGAKKPMDRTPWVFTGSQILDGQFMADIEGSIIATFRDPVALINNPLPHGADDTMYASNEKILPPEGTKILLTIRAAEKKAD